MSCLLKQQRQNMATPSPPTELAELGKVIPFLSGVSSMARKRD